MSKITLHDYDVIGTSVWDDRELDDSILGTLKAEVVESDELFLRLNYEGKNITFYVSLGLFETMLNKAKVTEPQFLVFDNSLEINHTSVETTKEIEK